MASVVVMSGGGIKGAVVATRAAKAEPVVLLHIDYGQPSATAELSALHAMAQALPHARLWEVQMPHVLDLQRTFDSSGSAGETDEPPKSNRGRELSIPVLRGLLPVLAATGVQCALRVGASRVSLGLSQHCDAAHLGLPSGGGRSTRGREFVHALNIMIEALLGRRGAVEVDTPLIDANCGQIHQLGIRYEVPFEKTWSCTSASRRPCGRCAACGERAAAFAERRLMDPILAATSA